jgi:hypothetical protein
MKKLNTLFAAISLGLTASFAVLPLTSAHSTLHIGNAHSAYMPIAKVTHEQQKYTPTHRHGFKPDEACDAVIGFSSQAGGTTVPAPGTPTGTPPVTQIQGENFSVPANCAFFLEDNITVQNPLASTPITNFAEANFQVVCTLYSQDGSNGDLGPAIATAKQTIDEDQQSATFPLSAYVAPTSGYEYNGYSGYIYGRYPLVNYQVSCSQTGPICLAKAPAAGCASAGAFLNGQATALTITSTGNVIVGKPYIAPAYSAEYYYSDGGYYARGIRHIIKH